MKTLQKTLIAFGLLSIFATGCKKDEQTIDTDYPVIDLSIANAFPVQCATVNRGQSFNFKARFTDNAELGSYSIDIHHNFDNHSHSTEVSDCSAVIIKTPIKPFVLINTFQIPAGQKTFEAVNEIAVPADIDPGDYHFLIKLTDKEGWQTIKGISIKIN